MSPRQLMLLTCYCAWMRDSEPLRHQAQRVMGLAINTMCTPHAPDWKLPLDALTPAQLCTLLQAFAYMELTIDLEFLGRVHAAVKRCSEQLCQKQAVEVLMALQRVQQRPIMLPTTMPVQERLLQVGA